MKQYIKNNVDTQLNNQCFGKFNMLDNVELEIKVLTNGDVGEAWEQPTFELIGVKMDKNEVRQTEGFEVLSLTEHTVKVALDEQFTTKDGVLDMQLVVKDNGRVSTCVFSFVVGKSLEGNIVESIRKIDTLDDLDVVVANLRDYEQQIDQIKTEVVATNEDIKIEEAKRKQDELVRVTKETARANAEAIRQVNEEMRIALYETAAPSEEERQANEETRMVNETNRKIAEQTRISNENSRILAEQNRNETFETNEGVRNLQENKRVANENARINKFGEFEKNEIIRLASENNRLIQEIERVNNEENRINAEANRQAQENNREATYTRFNEKEKERQKAEDARQVAEQQRVNAELLRDQNYAKAETNRNKLYEDCEAQRNADFGEAETIRHDTYAASEKERYTAYNQAELTRNQNEELRKNNESKRITNENTRIANEELRVQKEATRDAKVEEFLTRGEQTVIDIEQRTEEFLTRGEQVISDIEKRTDAALEILEGSAEEVADMRIDYMGNTHENMRQAANANVDYAVKTAIGEFNYLDYEGQHITANNSIEGHTKSAILKGMTLVNCYKILSTPYTYDKGGASPLSKITVNLSANKTYLILLDFSTVDKDGKEKLQFFPASTFIDGERKQESNFAITTNGRFTYKYTPSKDVVDYSIIIGLNNYEISNPTVVLESAMIIEYQEGMENWDIPYFEGMQSVRMPVLTITGKNLCGRMESGSLTQTEGMPGEHPGRIRTVDYIKIDSSYWVSTETSAVLGLRYYDNNKKCIGYPTITMSANTPVNITNIPSGSKYLKFTVVDITDVNYKIYLTKEKHTTGEYEPFKSNILTTPEDLELRGIGDVQDTLNLLTGELTQRIGEVVFDGSDDEIWGQFDNSAIQEKTCLFSFYKGLPTAPKEDLKTLSDKYIIEKGYGTLLNTDEEMVHIYADRAVYFRILKSKLSTQNVAGFKEWLSQNPFTIQYQLKTESVKTVDLSDNVVYSYGSTTHYSCSSEEGSLVPTLSVKVPTDVQATIAQQRNTIQALESENEALKDGLIEANQYRVDGDMDLLSNQWDIDFRLFEIEMVLDVPMMATFKLKETDIMSRFLQAKTLILGGRYERSKMEYQLKRYLEAGQLTQEEYDELISLMDARELVE
ncbi:hypothetical protein [Turicibacter sanguinis]|uniref:hypothetical protein n=1 Tax=Turicibacter sanguinis TaxID=154288 RepID=UPI0018A896AD|nr:hypothetical protein [Turicibacter sanguinis]MDB8567711.1 hypothetical protein [Turicibacter sanguinis]MDB8570460.1 hypothetical protein [Turicibacter sanguinis]MDB8573217.1 hypothetical protein [Turicibacter sanguinis]MDB8581968.1 hypothetical protein [Turicibacter sanguinis]